MRLLAKHWRIIAKALRFARHFCGESEATAILKIIGEQGEKAAPETPKGESDEQDD